MAWKDREQRNQYQRAYRLKLAMKPRVLRPRKRTCCLVCDQPIGRNSTKFCSNQCQRTYEHLQFVDKWLGGKSWVGAPVGFRATFVGTYLHKVEKGVLDAAGARDTR